MPIQLKDLKSAVVVEEEGRVIDAIQERDEMFRERNAARAAADPGHTVIQLSGGRPMISKRSDIGLIEQALPPVGELADLAKSRGFEWDPDSSPERVVRYWASDARGDRHGDVVDQSWDFEEYSDNPIMLFSHQWDEPPIGGILNWDVTSRKTRNYSGEALSLLSLFASKDASDKGDSVFRLVKAGFLKAGSVGFFPEQVIEVKDKKERQQLGLAEWGLLFRNNKLIEWSPCSVPANPGAHRTLSAAKSMNALEPRDLQVVRELKRQESLLRDKGATWKRDDAILLGIARNLFPDVRYPEHKDVDVPVNEEVREHGTVVSLEYVAEQVQDMRNEFVDTLKELTEQVADLQHSLLSQKPKKEEPATSDDDDVALDVVGAAAKMLVQRNA